MKKILIPILLISFLFSKADVNEYSIGLNDKTGIFGLFNTAWITNKSYGESYITAGSLIAIGSVGYGKKYYLSKDDFLSSLFDGIRPYVSWTSFGYYILPISENGDPLVSLGISAVAGIDITIMEWGEKNKLKFQFGILASYDPIRDENLIISGEGGPSFLMPSFNIKGHF